MNVLIVYAHPEPRSFNGALLGAAVGALEGAGHAVRVADLYAAGFDPVSDRRNFATVHDPAYFKQQLEEPHAAAHQGFAPEIAAAQQQLAWCEVMIWQFPLWWFGLPAVLKGWVDRVFAMGRAYGPGQVYASGPFRGKRALLSLTTGGGPADYLPGGLLGELAGILRPLNRGILEFTGFTVLAPHVVHGPARLSEAEWQGVLAAWTSRLQSLEQEPPFEVGTH